MWTPGHRGVCANEYADAIAKHYAGKEVAWATLQEGLYNTKHITVDYGRLDSEGNWYPVGNKGYSETKMRMMEWIRDKMRKGSEGQRLLCGIEKADEVWTEVMIGVTDCIDSKRVRKAREKGEGDSAREDAKGGVGEGKGGGTKGEGGR